MFGYRHPEPFQITAKARNEAAEALVRAVELEHLQDASDAEHLVHLDWGKGVVA